MSAMVYENGAYKEAETPKAWNGSAFVDTDGYYWENGVQKEGWSAAPKPPNQYSYVAGMKETLPFTDESPSSWGTSIQVRKDGIYVITDAGLRLRPKDITITEGTKVIVELKILSLTGTSSRELALIIDIDGYHYDQASSYYNKTIGLLQSRNTTTTATRAWVAIEWAGNGSLQHSEILITSITIQ